MNDLRVDQWNASYERKENHILYPKEEVVKFLSRFVRRRTGAETFKDVLVTTLPLRGLDLGCGIGRQTILLEEFGIHGYGVDISEHALAEARKLARSMGHSMDERFMLLKDPTLPFDDEALDIAIVDSVLDSMEFRLAQHYVRELDRTVKHFVYLSLIADVGPNAQGARDIEVTGQHEQGTIQSYYDPGRLSELIKDTRFHVQDMYRTREEGMDGSVRASRYHVVLHKPKA